LGTELGQGRPGWHIEDTAIAEHFFGPQYDIHGGAIDLIFPHHEAEIAQMEAVSGREPMVRYWLHSGLLKVGRQKMSKSLGNLVTIREALQTTDYRTLRFWFLSHHYRSSMEFNEAGIPQAKAALQRIESFVRSIESDRDDPENEAKVDEFRSVFYGHLDDDFDTPKALGALFEFIRQQNRLGAMGIRVYEVMREVDTLFDFIVFDWTVADAEIERLVRWRQELRESKRFAEADEIRRRLSAEGVVIEDTDRGARWFRSGEFQERCRIGCLKEIS
jgi:cysteinyl-tRNA synthetase